MGVHVKYVDEKQEDVIKNWNVTVLQVIIYFYLKKNKNFFLLG